MIKMLAKIATNRIQQQTGSLYLCIPQVWAGDNHLRKGDEMNIYVDEDGNLIVKKKVKTEV